MRATLLILSALHLLIVRPTFADSPAVAAAFAAATPTRYEGAATFTHDDPESGNARYRTYVFVMDASFRVNSLVVDGRRVNGVSPETPLAALPYPQKGSVRNFRLSLQAWDDLSPAAPQPSPVYSGPVVVGGNAPVVTDSTVGFNLGAESEDVTVTAVTIEPNGSTSTAGPRAAGTGYAEHDLLNRGDSVTVWLTPAELVRFLPVPEMKNPKGWTLDVYGGTASGAVLVNGQWGFWVFLDPNASWGLGYWLRGPGGFMDWGPLDPNAPASGNENLPLAAYRYGGVEVIDLRQKWPRWARVSATIDGQFSAGSGYDAQLSHNGEAVAVRTNNEGAGINVFYAGPSAYVLVRELDENGAPTTNEDGSLREWSLSDGGYFYSDRESSLSSFVPVRTGRASVLITPVKETARFGTYDLLVEEAGIPSRG